MVRTLKSYCKQKYDEYMKLNYNGAKKYQNFILSRSKEDIRLARVAQSFYFAKGDFLTANKFTKFTGEEYKTLKEFQESNNKYVYQFNERANDSKIGKAKLKKMIEKTMYEQGLSYYKVNKNFGFSRSKLNDFFKYNKHNVFSVKKLMEINKKLNQAYNN